jgi:hypothetical protein
MCGDPIGMRKFGEVAGGKLEIRRHCLGIAGREIDAVEFDKQLCDHQAGALVAIDERGLRDIPNAKLAASRASDRSL